MIYRFTILTITIIGLVLLWGCNSTYDVPEELVVGLSFEDDVVHPQVYSTYLDVSAPIAILSKEEAYDGVQSLKLYCEDLLYPQDIHWGYRHEDLTNGTIIKIKVRVKAVDLKGNGFFVQVIAREKDTFAEAAIAQTQKSTSTDGEWKEIELILDRPIDPNIGVVDILMRLSSGTSGSVYYDKLEIIEMTP